MGPKALRVTGELADGTLPYLAGRPKPRVVAAVPVVLTDDVDAGRDFVAEQLSFYETIPSYHKMIAREGVASAAELAAVGPAEAVTRKLKTYLDAGASDVVLSPLDRSGTSDREALWALAASL